MHANTDALSFAIPADAFDRFHGCALREGRWRLRRRGNVVSLINGQALYEIIGRVGDDLVLSMTQAPGKPISDYDYEEHEINPVRVVPSAIFELIDIMADFGGRPIEAGLAMEPYVHPPKPRKVNAAPVPSPVPLPRVGGHLPASTIFAGDRPVIDIVRRSFPRMASTFETIEWRHELLSEGRTVDQLHDLLDKVGLKPRSLRELRLAHDNDVRTYADLIKKVA